MRVRRERAAQDQIDHFFRTGEVLDFCEGPCANLSATRNRTEPDLTRPEVPTPGC